MKAFLPLAATSLVCACALPSCDKIRSVTEKPGKAADPKSSAATTTVAAEPYSGELVSELAESDYDSFRQLHGRVVIVDFYADRCGACRQLGPILHDIASEKHGLVLVGKINVDKVTALAIREEVDGIPDVRIFRDGKEVERFVGAPSAEEVRRKIEGHLKGVPPLPEARTAPKADQPVTQPMTKDWMPPGVKRR